MNARERVREGGRTGGKEGVTIADSAESLTFFDSTAISRACLEGAPV